MDHQGQPSLSKLLEAKTRAYLVAQSVKNPSAIPVMQENQVWSLNEKDRWRRKWQPTPVFFPGESHGQRRLEGTFNGVARVGHNLATKPNQARVKPEACNYHIKKKIKNISKLNNARFIYQGYTFTYSSLNVQINCLFFSTWFFFSQTSPLWIVKKNSDFVHQCSDLLVFHPNIPFFLFPMIVLGPSLADPGKNKTSHSWQPPWIPLSSYVNSLLAFFLGWR